MYNKKFEITLKKENNMFLKSNTFYEKIPKNDLYFLRDNIEFIDYHSKQHKDIFFQYQISQNINNNIEYIDLYISKNKDGIVPVKYFNIFNEHWGKMISNGIFFSETGNPTLRKNILNKYYYNFDLNSSEFSILSESCKRVGISCPVLDYFIKHKKELRKYIADYFSLKDEKICKDLIYSFYSFENNLHKYYENFNLDKNKKIPKIMIELREEILKVIEILKKYNPELWEYSKNTKIFYGNNFYDIENKKMKNNLNDFGHNNRKTYFLKLYKGEQEKRIMSGIIEWLYYNTNALKSNNKNGIFIFEYDGIYILKENVDKLYGNYTNFTNLLNKKIKEIFDINITWNCEISEDKKSIDITLNEKILFIEKNNFYELIDCNLIDLKLDNKIINDTDIENDVWNKYLYKNNILYHEQQLKLYKNNCKNNIVKINYNRFYKPWGLVYTYPFLIHNYKNIFIDENYYDFDLSGTGLVILENICDKYNIKFPSLKIITNKRKDYIEDFVNNSELKYKKEFSINDKKNIAKNIIFLLLVVYDIKELNEIIYKKYNIKIQLPEEFTIFINELKIFNEILIEKNPQLFTFCKKNFDKFKGKKFMKSIEKLGQDKLDRFFLKIYIEEQTVRIIDLITEYLYKNTNVMKIGEINGFYINEHDGFKLLKINVDKEFGNPHNLINLLNKKTKEILDIEWQLKTTENKKYFYLNYKYLLFTTIILSTITIIYLLRKKI